MSNGWIKLYRDLLDKPIWFESTPKQKAILITIMLMANNQPRQWEWQGKQYTAQPGQFVGSLQSIAEQAGTGINEGNVRTSLKRFESYGFLTSKSTNRNRLVTIVNWGKYQQSINENTSQSSSKIQATYKQNTTNKNLRTKELKDNVEKRSSDQLKGQVHEVIEYLNSKAHKKFKASSKDSDKLVRARLHEGHTLSELKRVIDIKVADWQDDPEMSKYLRPSTLFTSQHVENYLNEQVGKPANPFVKKSEAAELSKQFQQELQNESQI